MTFPPAKQLRWYVRRENVRDTRLGENPGQSLAWAVFPYKGRDENGEPIRVGRSTYFARRTAATHYAHQQARHEYGALR